MGQRPMSEICVFHHIPKTAGSALREILQKNYPGDAFVDHYGPPNPKDLAFYREYVKTMPRDERLCIASHGAANALPVLEDEGLDFRAIVVLRDPVERAISLYWFVQTLPESNAGRGVRVARAIRENEWSLRDVFENLGGSRPEESPLHRDFSVFFDFQTRSFLEPWQSLDDLAFTPEAHTDAVARVRDLLARHYVAGVQERFPDTVKKFASALGWSLPFRASKKKVNVGSTRPKAADLDADTLALVRRYNASDAALHALVAGA